MDVWDGRITCVFLGSSRHEILVSVEKKKLESLNVVSNIQILCGVSGLEDRASEILSGCFIRRFCAICMDKKALWLVCGEEEFSSSQSS